MTKLLIVDDEETILKQLKWAYKKEYDILTAVSAKEAIDAVRTENPELMILDLSLTPGSGLLEGFQVLDDSLDISPGLKVVVITGHDDRENALKALEAGAVDFYSKPAEIEELRIILHRAAYIHSLETELADLTKSLKPGGDFEGIIAMSPSMLDVFETVRKVATTDISVLITGESGTGKELIARAIHNRSGRNDKPFIPINCGAIPENLLESELFGHEKGSFTGADSSRSGKFETANGGTLFLDEIGELPLALQVKILRFLQDQVIERVGGQQPIQVDVRVIAATNRELAGMIEERTFREDLFYRINTIAISLPPLKERGDDVLLLAMRFLYQYRNEFSKTVRGFSQAAQMSLYNYPWPGNVRELENRVKRAVIMSTGRIIQPADLDLPIHDDVREDGPGSPENPTLIATNGSVSLKEARDNTEKRLILNTLLRCAGNVSAASQELDVSRPTLHDLMNKHGIDPAEFRPPSKKK
ncbi:MAG: PEP-CTERM-box response regulator transcription factor [Candidatus Krumholzibacteria bacterium]|nr:PEP-CTERM-box response regulator transcription factor [Candidatus Krumholzibacteria bacterium]